MTNWQTKRVTRPLIVDAAPATQTVIGSRWVKRETSDESDPWNTIVLTGLMDLGEVGGIEVVVTPLSFGPSLSTTADSLIESYQLEDHANDDLSRRIADAIARTAAL